MAVKEEVPPPMAQVAATLLWEQAVAQREETAVVPAQPAATALHLAAAAVVAPMAALVGHPAGVVAAGKAHLVGGKVASAAVAVAVDYWLAVLAAISAVAAVRQTGLISPAGQADLVAVVVAAAVVPLARAGLEAELAARRSAEAAVTRLAVPSLSVTAAALS
jgi:hypothetical protein